jgi:hypothetical protein
MLLALSDHETERQDLHGLDLWSSPDLDIPKIITGRIAVCPECGESFRARSALHTYCCNACKIRNVRRRAQGLPAFPKVCEPVVAELSKQAAAERTHCPHGHEYTEANTHFQPGQGRKCRRCHTDDMLARKRRER